MSTAWEHLDSCAVTRCSSESGVAGDEWHLEDLREHDERRVVGGHVVTQFPHPVSEWDMRVADDGQFGEIGQGVRCPIVADRPRTGQPPQRVMELDVQQVRCV